MEFIEQMNDISIGEWSTEEVAFMNQVFGNKEDLTQKYDPEPIPAHSASIDDWDKTDDLNRAQLTVEIEEREQMRQTIERGQFNRKRAKLDGITISTREEAAVRHQKRKEKERILNQTPAIIYLPNGSAEWSSRQVRQIWRAKLAEEQERIDEEAASLEYQLLAATTQQQTKELEEQQKLQQGSLLRQCYRELVEKL